MASINQGTIPGTIIEARAPTRIDLAGGTIDLWPIHLLLSDPCTVNMGISLYAHATVEILKDPIVILKSRDLQFEKSYTWTEISTINSIPVLTDADRAMFPASLELLARLVAHYLCGLAENPKFGIKLETYALSPAGAGLGGSSTLGVAISSALSVIAGRVQSGSDWTSVPDQQHLRVIETMRDIETRVIKVPAGVQDYYGAFFGGLLVLEWKPFQNRVIRLAEPALKEIEKRVVLFYSGLSRNSGINNWSLFRSVFDHTSSKSTVHTEASTQDAMVFQAFGKISAASAKLRNELLKPGPDWVRVGDAIDQDWQNRRLLASNQITTPEIDATLSIAHKLGAKTGKICGAGGGGCFFAYFSEPVTDSLKEKLRSELKLNSTQGESRNTVSLSAIDLSKVQILDFHSVPHGTQVRLTAKG